ncbi:SLC13 family permease [Streptococcus sobrinus]|uniref:SLC13 family permease n=1 Tax=Streptococcus sobrinus TaxID=1310 RepID=UPI0003113750|nr:SLC13 family permease [Streptococcus sobrinus]
MSPAVLALIMLAIVIVCIVSNKVPMNFVKFVVPVVFCLLMGYNITETSNIILKQISTVMSQTGYMLLFGLIYFVMLTETGMFDIMVNAVIKRIGNKLNVVSVMALTTVIGAIAYLTANMSMTYLITFPIVIPLFKKFKLNRDYAFIICQMAVAAMCWLPWGIGLIMSATMAGTNAESLAAASIPWGLCFIPAIVLHWVYFAYKHKKEHGTLGLPEGVEHDQETASDSLKDKPNARPKMFLANLIVFIGVIVALAYFKISSYLVFIAASIITSYCQWWLLWHRHWKEFSQPF